MERFNRTLGTALVKFSHQNISNWDKHLHAVLFAYRTTRQSSSKFLPFQLVYGLSGRLPIDLDWQLPDAADHPKEISRRASKILNSLEPNRLSTSDNLRQAQKKQKKDHDTKIELRTWKPNDRILLLRSHRLTAHDAKLESKWDGPFTVHEVLRPNVYKLHFDDNRLIRRPVHGDQLKEYKELLFDQGPTVYIDNTDFNFSQEEPQNEDGHPT